MPPAESTDATTSRPAELLAIGLASRLLGVDVDTLRRWANDGRVEAYATPGGHRRFARRSLERLARSRAGTPRPLASLGATPDRVSAAYRRRYAAPKAAERGLTASVLPRHRAAFREDGRRLVAALLSHLDADDPAPQEAAESDAARIVDALARRLARGGIRLPEAIGLFVAARRPFLAELGLIARRRSLDAARLSVIYEQASAVLDRLLVRFVDSHQAHTKKAGSA
jgi:excisionase family DNA binding protein